MRVPVRIRGWVICAVLEGDEQFSRLGRREVNPDLLQLGTGFALNARGHCHGGYCSERKATYTPAFARN